MDENKVMSRGLYATRLLADEAFMDFWSELRRDIQTASFSKAGTDSAERESVYFQLKGIHDVLGILEAYSKAAEEIANSYHVKQDNFDDD